MLYFRAGCHDDELERAAFLLGDVATLEGALAAVSNADVVVGRHVLTRQNESGRPVFTFHRCGKSSGGFLGVRRTNHIDVGDDAQATDCFNRLVGRAVFADTDGVVGEDVSDRQFSQAGEADCRAQIVGKDQEGRAAGAEQAVVSDAIADRAHCVLADAKPDIASG